MLICLIGCDKFQAPVFHAKTSRTYFPLSRTLFQPSSFSAGRASLIMTKTVVSASASVNGITIAYTIYSPIPIPDPSSTPKWMVFLNGLADPKESWSYQIPSLTKSGYWVLTFDNRGVGASSSPAGPYSASLMAADTKALLVYLGIEKFHLCGISMGGMLGLQFAIEYSWNILSLTLACTYAAPNAFCTRMFNLWADTAAVMGVPHVMRDVLLWCFTPAFFSSETRVEELREIEDDMRFMTMSTPAYLAQLAVIQRFDVREKVGRLAKIFPVMVLAGEEDILIPTALSRDLHEMMPGSVWKTCEGGHGCSMEFPNEFNVALLDFLDNATSG